MNWPNDKEFAFTVFDDTDNSTIENTKPVYDLLLDLKIRTTKSVWIYPPRGRFSGQCLSDPAYLEWVRELQSRGFEIGLHNVGDGAFLREEILAGIELFQQLLGNFPRIHANHASNPDNIYWLKDRFNWPFDFLYEIYCILKKRPQATSLGSLPGSPYFWGDVCKQHVDYIRNFTCRNINTLDFNPSMPYIDLKKNAYSNRWFSSSDAQTVEEFCDLLRPESIDRLRSEGGACIVYTHFASGFVDARGEVVPLFRKRMEYLASLNGFFEPTSTLLDYLKSGQDESLAYERPSVGKWLTDRIIKKIKYKR